MEPPFVWAICSQQCLMNSLLAAPCSVLPCFTAGVGHDSAQAAFTNMVSKNAKQICFNSRPIEMALLRCGPSNTLPANRPSADVPSRASFKKGPASNSDEMSALGQKQTLERARSMSALPPKADIGTQPRDVRFVPKADIASFDQLVSTAKG